MSDLQSIANPVPLSEGHNGREPTAGFHRKSRVDDFHVPDLKRFAYCYFVLRSDHATKPGGDVDLARTLAAQATTAGANVIITTARQFRDVGADDCLLLFNIDRPFDAALALSRAPSGTACFLYALHHPHAGIAKYLRSLKGRRRFLAKLAGYRPDRYEILVDIAKGLRGTQLQRIRMALRHVRTIRLLLSRCHLLVVSEQELDAIAHLYGEPKKGASRLPHPLDDAVETTALLPFPYVLIPGRIEPRKNQIEAVRALAAADLAQRGFHLVVVGASGSDVQYFQATLQACQDAGAIYLNQLPTQMFFPVLSSAALVINPSFFEVTSLIDLYAIRCGVPVITTQHAWYDPSPRLLQIDPDMWASDHIAISRTIDSLLPSAPDHAA